MGESYYVFVGCAEGQFDTKDGEKRSYANMYVITPVSDYVSDDYKANGFKAEKFSAISPDVWKDLVIGEKCKLYFDDKKRVALAASLGDIISLEP